MDCYYYSIVDGDFDLEGTTKKLNDLLLMPLVRRYNHEYAPRLLSRLANEPYPSAPRNQAASRGRIGLLIEFALVDILQEMVSEDTEGKENVTFNTTNQFADFFLRGEDWTINLRIDVKAFEDASTEASARFDVPMDSVDRAKDYILVARWSWGHVKRDGITMMVPEIKDAVIVSAYELALERDRRQVLAGGSFDRTGKPLAASMSDDTNFGKINRIIHASRANSSELDPYVRRMYEIITYKDDSM